MKTYRADLHIHSVLSPCGDLDMSPKNIVNQAIKLNLNIIGITDHNAMDHCSLVKKLGEQNGILVLQGAEVTTKEEVHCLVYFNTDDTIERFKDFMFQHMPRVLNDSARFGAQLIVNEDEHILKEVEQLLLVALDISITELRRIVNDWGGIFIPAHVDRLGFGLLNQLGFLPDNLHPDAIEIAHMISKKDFLLKHPEFENYTILNSSDAHYLDQIGLKYSEFVLNKLSYAEILLALRTEKGRRVIAF